MIRIGLIGMGHWGSNYLRILSTLDSAEVRACSDSSSEALAKARRLVPKAQVLLQADDMIRMPDIDAVIIAAPTPTHFRLTRAALAAGKHVLVEKPMALTSDEAKTLVQEGEAQQRVLMVGHTFLYNPAVLALKALMDEGQLGRLHYIAATRTNLGPIRQDVNVVFDLAPHDISILLYLLGSMPISVAAQGASFLKPGREDVAFLTLRFPHNIVAHIHVSWIEPVKIRRLTAIGERKMAVFDDVNPTEPLKIFDKSVTLEPPSYNDFEEFRVKIREGDVLLPKVSFSEPLRNECLAFIDSIRTGRAPQSDGRFGSRIACVLDALTSSLHSGGQSIPVNETL